MPNWNIFPKNIKINKMIFVDTNYFLRFLLKDEKKHSAVALDLFKKASFGEVELFTSLVVFFEIYWVLSSFYKTEKSNIKKVLLDILKMDFIEIENRDVLVESINNLDKFNYDLEDTFNLFFAYKNKAKDFKTFDQKLFNKYQLLKKIRV